MWVVCNRCDKSFIETQSLVGYLIVKVRSIASNPAMFFLSFNSMKPISHHLHIAVIGGGIAGIITAIYLSRVNQLSGRPIKISLFDRRANLLSGASYRLARLHMGGEYPQHERTAFDCVTGAFLFAQAFPDEVFSMNHEIDFLVTLKSIAQNELTLEQLYESYENNRRYYQNLYLAAQNNGYTSTLAPPGRLYRKLEKNEFSDLFAGGIRSHERGLNSIRLNQLLLNQLAASPAISCFTNVLITNIDPEGEGYRLISGAGRPIFADIVINAAWESSYYLNSRIDASLQPPKAYLRVLAEANITKCIDKGKAAFALINHSGGMYSPIDAQKALLYVPFEGYSHVRNLSVNELCPDNLKNLHITGLEEQTIKRNIFDHMTTLFPHLNKMEIEHLHVHPTFSFDDELTQRRHVDVRKISTNWYSVICTKATYSVWAALETIGMLSEESVDGFDLLSCPVIPEKFRFNSSLF